MASKGKGFFAAHAKSSAMIISVIVHAIILVVAISFVAVTVYVKKDIETFEGKTIKKPRLALRQLKVPVKANKRKPPKPKLTKRLVVNINRNMQNFKMPEITGVKSSMGSISDGGLGGVSDIGFSMPEINMWGAKSRGEKVFIILDSSTFMMVDELGGIEAYEIIKDQLAKTIDSLPPTALFNVAIYDRGSSYALFPQMVPATAANALKAREWLEPLNTVKSSMTTADVGLHTRGSSSQEVPLPNNIAIEPLADTFYFLNPALVAMKQEADVVFILTEGWRDMYKSLGAGEQWNQNQWNRWNKMVKKAKEKFAEENEERKKNGEPPRVVATDVGLVNAYFKGVERPPVGERYYYSPRDIIIGMEKVRKKYKKKTAVEMELKKRSKKENISVNVVQFSRMSTSDGDQQAMANLQGVAQVGNGEYINIAGLAAIKSYIEQEAALEE